MDNSSFFPSNDNNSSLRFVELQMDSSEPSKREGSPCQQGGDSQAATATRHSIPELPEVCWLKILMMKGLYS